MFEKVVIRRHALRGQQIDPGLLAESLLFYENVHLLIDGSILRSILGSIGPDVLLTLLEQRRVSATWLTDNLGVLTNSVGPISYHQLSAFTIDREKIGGHHTKPEKWVIQAFEDKLGRSGGSLRKARKLLKYLQFRPHVPLVRKPDGTFVEADPQNVSALARADIEDPVYLRFVIEEALRCEVPEYQLPSGWEFELIKTSTGYVPSTNLNFQLINEIYHKRVPVSENSIAPAGLLARALDARADLTFATDYMSEFVTDDSSSRLIQNRFNGILSRRRKSDQELQIFQEVLLANGGAIREAINSGERSFDDFLHLLDRAERFRAWLRGQNPDARLLTEYLSAATAESWTTTVPVRTMRFVFCALTGLGFEQLMPGGGGAAVGVGLEAFDQFAVDRLLKGWRPNQFVEGPLRRFVVTSD